MVRPGPGFSVQDVAFGWRDALRDLGVQVVDDQFDNRLDYHCRARIEADGVFHQALSVEDAMLAAASGLLAECFKVWPDFVVVVMGKFVPLWILELIRTRGIKVVAIATESPYEDAFQLDLAAVVDLLILTDPTSLEKFRTVNPNTFYVPHAYDPKRHYPGPPVDSLRCDFGWVGTAFESRIELFEAVDWSGLDVLFGGNWTELPAGSVLDKYLGHERTYCMDNDETANLYRSARSSLNLYRREHHETDHAHGTSIGPREVELAACQTFFLRDPRPEGDAVFSMLPTFTEAAEIRPLLDWWLSHDRSRELAAQQARAAIIDRTFTENAKWLLRHLYESR